MKNSLSENMLRFGTKNLSKNEKRILEQISEQEQETLKQGGGNNNAFPKFTLYVDIDKNTNRVKPGSIARYEITLDPSSKGDAMYRFVTKYNKAPQLNLVRFMDQTISDKTQIPPMKFAGNNKIVGSFGLAGPAAVAASKGALLNGVNDLVNKGEQRNSSNVAIPGVKFTGVQLEVIFPKDFLTSNEQMYQDPRFIEVIGIAK